MIIYIYIYMCTHTHTHTHSILHMYGQGASASAFPLRMPNTTLVSWVCTMEATPSTSASAANAHFGREVVATTGSLATNWPFS